jgi:hypothetical protein
MPDPARRAYRIRVALWLCILAGVLLYAARDYSARQTRRSWQRPLQVALVLLRRAELDAQALARLTLRLGELEAALEREFVRHGGGFRPIRFHKFGPVLQERPVPVAADHPSFFQSLRLSLALRELASDSDERAQVPDTDFDGRIYVLLSPPESDAQALAEGLGEDGGRIAITSLELSEHSVDFGLFVVTHELFHLLGAGDRYAADGTAQLPDGLGEPELVPLYPQRTVEVMARGRVIAPGEEVPPSELDELRVGTMTAREIGWLR